MTAGCAAGPQAGAPVASVGFTSYGGERTVRAGTGIEGAIEDWIVTRQVTVTDVQPASASPRVPIIFMPGFAIAADSYLTTPDGREGWAMDFVRRGHPAYLVEPSHSTRSGIDTGFNLRGSSSAKLFSWGGDHVWRRWGLGPAPGVHFADSRFPAGSWSKVVATFTGIEAPTISGTQMVAHQVEANLAGLHQLQTGKPPAVIIAHSAAGVSAFAFAARYPDQVAALVVVEPVGCPAAAVGVPVLAIFADHMEVREQMLVRADECKATVAATRKAGIKAEYWSLPERGIAGNSHLLMMETNSKELAGLIAAWIDDNA
jgi:pimeloyl-ACP methyl ester carboxylesterase